MAISSANNDAVKAAGRYEQLAETRRPHLDRARDCAKVTIPALFPPEGFTTTSRLYVPFQGMGARGVSNLASKLLLSLLPPNSPFFRLVMDDYAIDRLNEAGNEALRSKVDAALNKIERAVQDHIESSGLRVASSEVLKHLIVGGNVMPFLNPKGGTRVFKLHEYVVKRDAQGNAIEIITCERLARSTLPDNIRAMLPEVTPKFDARGNEIRNTSDDVDVYTWVRRTDTNWTSHQEVADLIVPDSEGTYPLDKSPYIPMRWTRVDGEDYGRSYIEEYLGDLYSLEGLSKAIVEGSAAAAKILVLVKPGSPTSAKQIAQKPSGSVIPGNKDDVSYLQMEKYADFRIAKETIDAISQRLSFAFLLNSSIQRNGERVTAEEIRYMARELEDALGGVYSVLSSEFQLPLVQRLLYTLERAGKLPDLPKDVVKPAIVTGLEALGRGQDFTKLQMFLKAGIDMLGQQAMAQFIDVNDALTRLGAAVGLNTDGLVKTRETIQQEQAQAQQQAMMAQLGPQAINALGGMGKEAMAIQAQAAQQDAAPAAEGEPTPPSQ
jgi:hypothetical protein